jgi:hypothetical protein
VLHTHTHTHAHTHIRTHAHIFTNRWIGRYSCTALLAAVAVHGLDKDALMAAAADEDLSLLWGAWPYVLHICLFLYLCVCIFFVFVCLCVCLSCLSSSNPLA